MTESTPLQKLQALLAKNELTQAVAEAFGKIAAATNEPGDKVLAKQLTGQLSGLAKWFETATGKDGKIDERMLTKALKIWLSKHLTELVHAQDTIDTVEASNGNPFSASPRIDFAVKPFSEENIANHAQALAAACTAINKCIMRGKPLFPTQNVISS